MEINIKDIEILFDKKVKPINEAIAKLTTSTVILEKSFVRMEETQRQVTALLIAREKVSSDVEHLDDDVKENKLDINKLYTLIREGSNQGKQWLFMVLLALGSGGFGAFLSVIAFKFR